MAHSRLQTIDTALAKLEAAVPDIDNQAPTPDNPAPTASPTPIESPSSQTTNQIQTEIENAKSPTPIPSPSIQALESYLGGAI